MAVDAVYDVAVAAQGCDQGTCGCAWWGWVAGQGWEGVGWGLWSDGGVRGVHVCMPGHVWQSSSRQGLHCAVLCCAVQGDVCAAAAAACAVHKPHCLP